ncbi:MAG TPA: hypothetical protein P5509_08855, partial [Bacteroidales bacterium]|nr:hypothetical protein [Bacteroidales bacterium]
MKRRIPSFDDFIFESYTLKQVCNIQASGSVKQSCDIIFNSTPDDTFELINVRVKDIKAPKGLTLSFYKRRSLDEDVAIVERLITAYSNGEKVPPIIVDYDMTIMDGLHRYVAIKEYFGNNGKVEVFQKNKNMNESLYERSFPESDVSFVKKILNKHKDDLIGKGLGNLEIEQKLNKIFMKYNMEFSVGFGTPAFDDSARVGLVEAAIDEDGRIHIHYKEYFYEIFEDDELWNEFITVLSRIVAHERTHLHQLKQIRNGRDITDYYEILSKVKADLSNRYKYLSNK